MVKGLLLLCDLGLIWGAFEAILRNKIARWIGKALIIKNLGNALKSLEILLGGDEFGNFRFSCVEINGCKVIFVTCLFLS